LTEPHQKSGMISGVNSSLLPGTKPSIFRL